MSYNIIVEKHIKIKFFCLFILFFLFLGIKSPFSEGAIDTSGSTINAEIYPENPKPYEKVTIKLSSYAIDINKAMIVWLKGSDIVLSGYGSTSYSFETSGPDTATIFDIKITPAGSNDAINKRVTIISSDLEILWESIGGNTPPFYKGKALPTQEDVINVVAIPNTKTIKSGMGEMTYTWKSNDNTVLESSGYNKNSYKFQNSVLNDKENIKVRVSSLDGQYNTEGEINIDIKKPFVLFYKKTPYLGVLYNEAFKNETQIYEGETTIVAEPYFLSSKNQEYDFVYTWEMNGEKINTPVKNNEITVRPTSMGGYTDISFKMESITRLFQRISSKIRLNL